MNFEALRRRVKRAEAVVAIRCEETGNRWDALRQVWREGWTPLRIITVGLAGGFIAGKLEPGKARFHGARWLQMIGAVSNLVTTAKASFAAEVEAAATAAAAAAGAGTETETARRAQADEAAARATAPPRAAEAATEVSES